MMDASNSPDPVHAAHLLATAEDNLREAVMLDLFLPAHTRDAIEAYTAAVDRYIDDVQVLTGS